MSTPDRGRFRPSAPFLTPEAAMGSLHQPVLVNEIVAWLTPREGTGSIIVDGTAGGGGHTVALARRLGAGGRLIGLDRDPAMLDLAEKAVKAAGSPLPVTLVHAAYREMRRVLDELGIDRVQGVLLGPGALVGPACLGRTGGSASRPTGRSTCGSIPTSPARARPTWSIKCERPIWPSCSLNWGRNGSAGGSPAGSWKTAKARPIQTTGQLAELVRTERPGPGAAWADRPGHTGLPGTADRGQRRARPARRHARGDPRAAGARRKGRDHQLSLAGRPPRQVGVQDQSQADRPDQETRDRDGPGTGRQPPSAKRQTEGGGAMPEPVVIIGPAARPAGPARRVGRECGRRPLPSTQAARSRNPQRTTLARSPRSCPRLLASPADCRLSWYAALWALLKRGLNVARRYPRHSLAAGASILILGATLYTQLRSGQSAHKAVTAKIPGDGAKVVAKNDTGTGSTKSTDPSKDGSKKDSSHDVPAPEPGTPNPGGTATATLMPTLPRTNPRVPRRPRSQRAR